MELFITAEYRAKQDNIEPLADALKAVITETRREPGCIHAYVSRSIAEPGMFHILSQWADDDAFDRHITLPHTMRFLEEAGRLVSQSQPPRPMRALV